MKASPNNYYTNKNVFKLIILNINMKKEAKKEKEISSTKVEKKDFRFSNIFSLSWNDFIDNFGTAVKLGLLFNLVPQLISFILFGTLIGFGTSIETYEEIMANLPGLSVLWTFSFLMLFVSMFLSLCFVYISLNKGKNFKSAIKESWPFYWKYAGLSIVTVLALIGLFLLLVVPGIIFSVYWIAASIILVYEKKGIIESLKTSKQLVKRRWWKVFGYIILFGLIIGAIAIIISATSNLVSVPSSNSGIIIYGIVKIILSMLLTVAGTLLWISFIKNLYLKLKN